MTVTNTLSRTEPLATNGSATVFPYGFRVLAAGDIEVIYTDENGASETVAAADYTVDGVGEPTGGNVTFDSAPAADGTVVIRRAMTLTQPTNLRNQSSIYLEAMERALDRLTLIAQQVNEGGVRAIKTPAADDPDLTVELPPAAVRAGGYLTFDEDGGVAVTTAVVPDEVAVSAFMEGLLDDADAAAGRTTLGAASLAANTFTGTQTMNGAAVNEAKGSNIASATSIDLGAATGNFVDVTGTTTIESLGTVQAGTRRRVRFTGALTLTHHGTSLILPGGANITTAAGDIAVFVSLGSGNWVCVDYQRASGRAVVTSDIPVGTVLDYSGTSLPTGFLWPAGQNISRSVYSALFTAIGETYGVGDGSTTFAVPDLRGRAVFGKDDMGGSGASRVTNGVSGITGTTLGAAGGGQAFTPSTGKMAAHTHGVPTTSGSSTNPNTILRGETTAAGAGVTASSGTGSDQEIMPPAMMLNKILYAGV